jgi:signal transduction histidine kinase
MIDCPYFIEGKFAGFFSCRAVNRKWSAEDMIFIRAICNMLPLAFKSHHRKRQQTLLESKQRQIEELNDSLEKKVTERTAELKFRNEQLTDFAFINAHEIRGPICRLLGLRNLLMLTKNPEEIIALRDYMTSSIDELDAITRKANELLSETMPGKILINPR